MEHLFLGLSSACAFLLAPVIAALVIVFEPGRTASPWTNGLGLTIGLGTASVIPLTAALHVSGGYRASAAFGVAGLALGAALVRAHLRRLRRLEVASGPLALGCVAFWLLLAATWAPTLAGAELPAICGEFAAESCGGGTRADFLRLVAPSGVVLALEVWLLRRTPREAPA